MASVVFNMTFKSKRNEGFSIFSLIYVRNVSILGNPLKVGRSHTSIPTPHRDFMIVTHFHIDTLCNWLFQYSKYSPYYDEHEVILHQLNSPYVVTCI